MQSQPWGGQCCLPRTNTHELPGEEKAHIQLQDLATQGWSTQRATVSSDQRDKRTRIWLRSRRKVTDKPQHWTVTGTASSVPQHWLGRLSAHTGELHLAILNVHIHTYISINIIFLDEVRRADEQGFALPPCKQQQHLPIATTTKGRRSLEVHWVLSD